MELDQLLTSLKKGEYRPVYFLHGDESYFIDLISDFVESNALSASEKAFNQTVLYGKDSNYLSVLDAASRYPMMAPRQVVILKEAQDMKDLESLTPYIEKPMTSTILVICYKHKAYKGKKATEGNKDAESKKKQPGSGTSNAYTPLEFKKSIEKNAVVFLSKKLYDNQIPDWIKNYLAKRKFPIESEVTSLLAEYLGNDLQKITNELEKLILNLPPGTKISAKEIEENIGISKDYNIFELQKALAARDILKATRIVNYFAANERKHPMIMLIGSLGNFFTKLFLYHQVQRQSQQAVLKALGFNQTWMLRDYQQAISAYSYAQTIQIISILKEYDLKSKGVEFTGTNIEPGALLREMVWKILHL